MACSLVDIADIGVRDTGSAFRKELCSIYASGALATAKLKSSKQYALAEADSFGQWVMTLIDP
jgi:hypothetical protein